MIKLQAHGTTELKFKMSVSGTTATPSINVVLKRGDVSVSYKANNTDKDGWSAAVSAPGSVFDIDSSERVEMNICVTIDGRVYTPYKNSAELVVGKAEKKKAKGDKQPDHVDQPVKVAKDETEAAPVDVPTETPASVDLSAETDRPDVEPELAKKVDPIASNFTADKDEIKNIVSNIKESIRGEFKIRDLMAAEIVLVEAAPEPDPETLETFLTGLFDVRVQ